MKLFVSVEVMEPNIDKREQGSRFSLDIPDKQWYEERERGEIFENAIEHSRIWAVFRYRKGQPKRME